MSSLDSDKSKKLLKQSQSSPLYSPSSESSSAPSKSSQSRSGPSESDSSYSTSQSSSLSTPSPNNTRPLTSQNNTSTAWAGSNRPASPAFNNIQPTQTPPPKQAKSTPTHHVLQNLFTHFVKAAEIKLNTLMFTHLDREVDLSLSLRPGYDLAFDRILASMGSVAKHCPKLIIDSIMVWRKTKSESAGDKAIPGDLVLIAKMLGFPQPTSGHFPQLKGKDMEAIVRERKSLASNYILCRVLLEIIHQLSADTLPEDLGEKLEDMVFGQLKNADPELTSRNINRQANIDFFAELIGALSAIRFTAELSKSQSMRETKVELIIRSMRFLKLKIYPMDALEETAEFLQTCAEFFQNSHNIKIKHAYAEVLAQLLDPIAVVATAEVNLPAWMKSVDLLFPKASKMCSKPRHIHAAIPLVTTLLCVSRKEFFLKNWYSFFEICFQRLRDKLTRNAALVAVVRLVWVYLFRCQETSSATAQKRMENVMKLLFPPNRRGMAHSGSESVVIDLFTQIVWFTCLKYQEYGLEGVFPLLLGVEGSASALSYSTGTSIAVSSTVNYSTMQYSTGTHMGTSLTSMGSGYDDYTATVTAAVSTNVALGDILVNPERLMVVFRSYLLLLADTEDVLRKGGAVGPVSAVSGAGSSKVIVESKITLPPPSFPSTLWNLQVAFTSKDPALGGLESLVKMRERVPVGGFSMSFGATLTEEQPEQTINGLLDESVHLRMGASMRNMMEKLNDVLGRALIALDSSCGYSLFFDPAILTMNTSLGTMLGGSMSSAVASTLVVSESAAPSSSTVSRRNSFTGSNPNQSTSSGSIDQKERPDMKDKEGSKEKQLLFDLLRTCIDSLPRLAPTTCFSSPKLVETLSRWMLHMDKGVRHSAAEALKRIARLDISPTPTENLPTSPQTFNPSRFWHMSDQEPMICKMVRLVSETCLRVCNDMFTEMLVGIGHDGYESSAAATVVSTCFDLLEIWYSTLDSKGSSGLSEVDMDFALAEMEGMGLVYLCSSVPAMRRMAIKILRLAAQFEIKWKSEKKPHDESTKKSMSMRTRMSQGRRLYITGAKSRSIRSRIITVMDDYGPDLLKKHYFDPSMTAANRSEPLKSHQQQKLAQNLFLSPKASLIKIAESDSSLEMTMWSRCFPDLIKFCFEHASPRSMAFALRHVLMRITSVYPTINHAAEGYALGLKTNLSGTVKWTGSNANVPLAPSKSLFVTTATDDIVDQWKFLLLFACSCIDISKATELGKLGGPSRVNETLLSGQYPDPSIHPARPMYDNTSTRVMNSKQLFQLVFPLLSSERSSIRHSAVVSLGCLHWISYQSLLEDIQPYLRSISDEMRHRLSLTLTKEASTSSSGSSDKKKNTLPNAHNKKYDRLRTEMAHLLSLVTSFVSHDIYRKNESFMSSIYVYMRDTARFLSDPEMQLEWDHQMLRFYFCVFLEKYFESLVKSLDAVPGENIDRYVPFDTRLALFRICEQWCGHGLWADATREREAKMMQHVLDQVKDIRERGFLTTSMEEQRKALEFAALKAMASLCSGSIVSAKNPTVMFDLKSIVAWIDSIFASADEKLHDIGRAALENLLKYNQQNGLLISNIINQCYTGLADSQITKGYFMALVDIFTPTKLSNVVDSVAEELNSNASIYPLQCAPHRLICLALYKAGDPSLSVRKAAIRLLHCLEKVIDTAISPDNSSNDALDYEPTSYEASAITSSLPIIYKYAQAMVSARLANDYGFMMHDILSEMIFRIEMIASGRTKASAAGIQGIRDVLILMVPWVKRIDVSRVFESSNEQDPVSLLEWQYPSSETSTLEASDTLLNNLFYLTIKYGDQYITEVENIWVQLVDHFDMANDLQVLDIQPHRRHIREYEAEIIMEKNINLIIEFLLMIGIKKRNPKFVNYAKKVVVYLTRTTACKLVIEGLVSRITPKSLVPAGLAPEKPAGDTNEELTVILSTDVDSVIKHPLEPVESSLYKADLEEVLPEMPKRPAFSKGQLACVLLVDLTIEVGSVALKQHLPLLLTVIFVQLDHFIALVCEQNRLLLVNLIHAIIPREIGFEMIDEILSNLNAREGKRMWAYEDIHPKIRSIESTEHLSRLVEQVAELFSLMDPTLAQSWGEMSLLWGTSCPVRHVACRSLQMLRALAPAFTRQMLGELLHRLSNTIADPTDEIQGFALEILETLDVMFDSLESHRIILFPQFFWACVACLSSPLEWEFIEAVRLLTKFLACVNVKEPSVVASILTNIPTKWKNEFKGLLPLLLRGISCANSESVCLELIRLMMPIDSPELVDIHTKHRVLFSVLSYLPRLLQGFESDPGRDGGSELGVTLEDCLEAAGDLSLLCDRYGFEDVGRLLSSYSKQKFRSREDFIRQLAMSVRMKFFPEFKTKAQLFLMGFLASPIGFYRRKSLKVLKFLLPASEPNAEIDEDLNDAFVGPLLSQLQTDIGSEALEVLDEAIKGTIASDESNVRIVFGGRSIHKITKEVSAMQQNSQGSGMNNGGLSTLSLSIPGYDANGWKTKDPMISSKHCRYNMLGVAATCAGKKFLSTAGLQLESLEGGTMASHQSNEQHDTNTRSLQMESEPQRISVIQLGGSLDHSFFEKQEITDEAFRMEMLMELDELETFFGNMLVQESTSSLQDNDGSKSSLPLIDTVKSTDRKLVHKKSMSLDYVLHSPASELASPNRSGRFESFSDQVPQVMDFSEEPQLAKQTMLAPISTAVDRLEDQVKLPLTANPRTSSAKSTASMDASLSRRLLSQPDASIFVTIRIKRRYDVVMANIDRLESLTNDISLALLTDHESIQVVRIDPVDSEVEPKDMDTLITVEIASGDPFSSVAYAEELVALVEEIRCRKASPEASQLLSGGFSRDIDASFTPLIHIRISGMEVPFAPEGWRLKLAQNREKIYQDLQTQAKEFQVSYAGDDPQGTLQSIDLFRVFPICFRLSMQLYDDWLITVGDLIQAVPETERKEFLVIYDGMRNVRLSSISTEALLMSSGNGAQSQALGHYKPPLLSPGALDSVANMEIDLGKVAERFISYTQADPGFRQEFLTKRAVNVKYTNDQLSAYLQEREKFATVLRECREKNRPKSIKELFHMIVHLGASYLVLYKAVIILQAVLEQFLGVSEVARDAELNRIQQCQALFTTTTMK